MQERPRKDHSIRRDHQDIGARASDVRDSVLSLQGRWLEQWECMLGSKTLDRAWLQTQPAAERPIGLGEDQRYLVAGPMQGR
jgi:hypothetical protein